MVRIILSDVIVHVGWSKTARSTTRNTEENSKQSGNAGFMSFFLMWGLIIRDLSKNH